MKPKNCPAIVALCLLALFARGSVYADDAPNTLDVTKKVQQEVKGNSLTVKADTNVLGAPIPNTQKRLKIEYTVNGTASSKVVMEGGVLEIHPTAGAKLVVTKATYGDLVDEKKVDVAGRVTEAVQGDKLSLPINNETMGGDPAPTTVKTLEVTYTVGGKPGKTRTGEFTTLVLPLANEGTCKLIILSATYGDL